MASHSVHPSSRGGLAAVALLAVTLATVPGCGGGWTYQVQGTSRDPGAEGTIQVSSVSGTGRNVVVDFAYLTPPDRLGPGRTTYVMWFRSGEQTINAGELQYNANDGRRPARGSATSPFPNFEVLVTAETGPEVGSPSEHIVIRQAVDTQ
ncbi:MAG: hypothetical protein ACFCGT_12900 [Sandaracinaceae bacterium]